MTPMTPSAALRTHTLAGGESGHVDRIIAQHKADGIGVMHGDIQHDPAAGRGIVDPPPLQCRRQMDRVEDPHRQHLTERALPDQIAHPPVQSGIAQMVISGERHPGIAGPSRSSPAPRVDRARAAFHTGRACPL